MADTCIKPDGIFDELAVECAIAGRRVRLTFDERIEVVRRLTAKGLSAKEIAERLALSDRQVVRYRRRISALVTAS